MKICLQALNLNKPLWLVVISLIFSSGNSQASSTELSTKNSLSSKDIPYVLLISIDGYRWDYTEKYSPSFIAKFKKQGASLKSLRPSFPTTTFPNHLSIATGRYPMNHGIVSNKFYNPELKRSYSIRDAESVADSEFYHSLPIWGLAEKQGVKTAPYFWPGSASHIQGVKPSYNIEYEHKASHETRIKTVEDWFKLPEEVRPHLVTLYFHDVDGAGHGHGPNSDKVQKAIEKVDHSIEKLVNNLEKLKLPINIIITSDHGMAELKPEKIETILKTTEQEKLFADFMIQGNGYLVSFRKRKDIDATASVALLNSAASHFKCYTPSTTPKELHYRNNPSIGDIVCLADRGWSISAKVPRVSKGSHGWSQYDGMDMHGIFYALGPNFKENLQIETQENVNIYPLIANILGLKIEHEIDGKLENMQALLN
ncbi:ectonucleotide pyrophosphatase/phosphodiesterase [Paraglaciecola sp. L3A3]|uniref:alkaline phosphatase family protein n=1 Tax=Paraglaciecola sp. L3A3 TaxID=2686358 RepID=UPI00131ABBDC|nr:ectonucleotide pyrophosphatase/phosphodiesterase [Paraglaciecola sp. L3A3]